MPGSISLCNKVLSSDFDKEDVNYIKESLYTLITEPKSLSNYESERHTNNNLDSFMHDSFNLVSKYHNEYIDRNVSCAKGHQNPYNDVKYTGDKGTIYKDEFSLERQHDAKMLLRDILQKGVDSEDLNYLRRAFNFLLCNSNGNNLIGELFFDSHPCTADDPYINNRVSSNGPLNKSGSARTESYFTPNKISIPKKRRTNKYSTQAEGNFPTPYNKNYKGIKKAQSRDARNDQRRLSTAYQSITDSHLLKLNDLKFRKKKLRLGKSEIHGLGVFASEAIPQNEIIIEYVGQIIRPIIADIREKYYKSSGIGSYCFRIDEDMIIDATKHGNLNRYVNHSCNPNSYAKILNIDNKKKIVLYSKRLIKIDEEITYDYKMPFEDDKIICLCKARNCKKSLN